MGAACLAGLTACSGASTNGPEARPGVIALATDSTYDPTADPAATHGPIDAPAPPGVPTERIQPLQGEALERAQLPWPDVLASFETPDWLAAIGDTSEDPPIAAPTEADTPQGAPEPRASAEPSLRLQLAYARALIEADEQRRFDAIRRLLWVSRQSPGEPDVLSRLGRLYLESGNLPQATEYLRRAIEADPADPDGYFLLGQAEARRNNHPLAMLLYERVASRVSAASEGVLAPLTDYHIAVSAEATGHARVAQDRYRAFLNNDPSLLANDRRGRMFVFLRSRAPDVLMAIGDIRHRLGDPHGAKAVYQASAEAGGVEPPQALVGRLIYTHLRLGEVAEAHASTVEALSLWPDQPLTADIAGYAARWSPDPLRLAQQIRDRFADRPAGPWAVTVAAALPRDQAIALLKRRLALEPRDDDAFAALTESVLAQPSSEGDGITADRQQNAVAALAGAARDRIAARPDDALSTLRRLESAAQRGDRLDAWMSAASDAATQTRDPVLWLVAASAAQRNGRADLAEPWYATAVQNAPNLSVARRAWVELALDRGAVVQAEDRLGPWQSATHADALAMRVRILWAQNQRPDALRLLDATVDNAVSATELVALKARVLADLGQADRALATAEALTARAPSDQDAQQLLFDLFLQRNNNRDGPRIRQAFLNLRNELPRSRVTRRVTARLLIDASRYDDAATLLATLEREPQDDQDRLAALRLRLALGQGEDEQALAWFDRLAASDFYDPKAMLGSAELFNRLRDGERLLIAEGMVFSRLSASPALVAQYAGNLLARGLYEQAAVQADRGMDLFAEPAHAGSRIRAVSLIRLKGLALAKQDRPHEAWLAVEDWVKSLDEPERERFADQIAGARADVAETFDRPDLAAWASLQLLQQDQTALTKNNVAYRLARNGVHLAAAERLVRESLEVRPDRSEDLDTLGWVLYKQGAYDQAVDLLRRSIDRIDFSDLTEAHRDITLAVVGDHLGDALYRQGDAAGAEAAWREAFARSPLGSGVVFEMDLWRLHGNLRAKIAAIESGEEPPVAAVVGPPPPDAPSLEQLLDGLDQPPEPPAGTETPAGS